MVKYYKYQIHTNPETAEILLAFLGDLPFDTFQETEDGLDAFVPENAMSEAITQQLDQLKEQFGFEFNKTIIEPENWNKVWESNFQPIIVETFCGLRADFHESIPNVEHEIIINPKMAFGTGHHATTYMVIQNMQNLDFQDKKVFDYGCGTGILAILAKKLKATEVIAVDIERPSYDNTIENATINEVKGIKTIHGTLENVEESGFDIILANINRNVILNSLPALNKKLVKNGKLIVSGFIEQDASLLLQASNDNDFLHLKTSRKENWISMVFEKS